MLSKYKLPNQSNDEKVLKIIRRDLFILIKKILVVMILMLLPLVFYYLLLVANMDIYNSELFAPLSVLGISIYYLCIWLFFFFFFADYYLDVWIITNHRIIDIEQQGLFSRIISEQKLDRIQDVTSETTGFFPTVLAYGEVYIQTAGAKERFRFRQVPNPDLIRDMIIKLAEDNKKAEKTN